MKLINLTLMILLAILANACGTVQCLTSDGEYYPGRDPVPPSPNAVYGGVQWDLISSPTADDTGLMILDAIPRLIDLPLSAVLDTLVLPYTVFSEEIPVRSKFHQFERESDMIAIKRIISSFHSDLVKLSADYPELKKLEEIKVFGTMLVFTHDCRYMGKRGYEDTGPNPVAIGLEIVSGKDFAEVLTTPVPLQAPSRQWESLNIVAWITIYTGNNPSKGLSEKLNGVLDKHLIMIDNLEKKDPRLRKAESLYEKGDYLKAREL